MVEVVGVEPTSEKRVTKASTCVSFYLASRRTRFGRRRLTWRPASMRSRPGNEAIQTLRPALMSPCPAPRDTPRATRHDPFLGREGEVVVRRYFCRFTRDTRHAALAPLLFPVETGTPPSWQRTEN